MGRTGRTVLTIGHSTHPSEVFVDLLQRHSVTAVADVRAVPYSRFNPQFNREPLADTLTSHGMAYVFLGLELGGRSDDPVCYDNGRICYDRLGATHVFRHGLERVVQGATEHRIALMCAEREPLECHRGLLLAPALANLGLSVVHIRPEVGEESHANTMERLLEIHQMQDAIEQQQLFPRSRAERFTEAIARQAQRFAHRKETLQGGSAQSEGELQS